MRYDTDWDPKEYLAQYYATDEVAEDERCILTFIRKFLDRDRQGFAELLEVGCGPTIHHVLPFLPRVERFYQADYLESNLDEIRRWVSGAPGAHDWAPYIHGVLKEEGETDPGGYERRVQLFREKLGGLLHCDVHNAPPIVPPKTFSLVVSCYCVDCATAHRSEWTEAMRNLSSLVAPGGWLILSALRNAKIYRVLDKEFPSAHVDENDVRGALLRDGYRSDSMAIEAHEITQWAGEGFTGIVVAAAQKK